MPWGPSILADLHLGGAIMWIGGDGLMLLWVAPLVARWVRYETKKTAELDAELDQLGL
jgi:cytochrome c oxidase assembly factor CtaG